MKNKTRILFLILTILIIILAILEMQTLLRPKKVEVVAPTTKKIGIYQVSVNQTEYQKTIEPLLSSALTSNNEEEILTNITKYFIADYFTLKNKTSYNNVGGLSFIINDIKEQFKLNAIDSYYRDLLQLSSTYGKDNMPEVNNVEIINIDEIKTNKIILNEDAKLSINKAFNISTSFTYIDNSILDKMDIVNKVNIVILQASDNNYYVYEIEGV